MHNLAADHPALLADLWGRLNRSYMTWFHSRTPAALLGNCNATCANAYWQKFNASMGGPVCGVPGC